MRNVVLINPHQGLGDLLLCTGIFREYSRKHRRIFITVRRNYFQELSSILGDLHNVTLIVLPTRRLFRNTRLTQRIARLLGIRVIGLGGYGKNFLESEMRFDHNFYHQAGVDFECRWTSFSAPRDIEKEEELFRLLNCGEAPYLFVHEDERRKFVINRKLLPGGLRIIEPTADHTIYNLIDYRKVIEHACEIHVIESSFAAYIESLTSTGPLFAHRYARPETYHDYRYEFTYKKLWKIFD